MKANELQIGDWVAYDGDVEYTNPIRIEGMDIATGMCITSDRDDVGFDGVWPIPLTADILEKNGFSHIMYSDAYYSIMIGDTYVELRKYENMAVWFNCKENNDGVYADYILPMPEFVHELQHALRLCGIDKEIEL